MIIFGKEERAKFEADRADYSKETQTVYDESKTYSDGKWILFEPKNTILFEDFIRLLRIKRNRTENKIFILLPALLLPHAAIVPLSAFRV